MVNAVEDTWFEGATAGVRRPARGPSCTGQPQTTAISTPVNPLIELNGVSRKGDVRRGAADLVRQCRPRDFGQQRDQSNERTLSWEFGPLRTLFLADVVGRKRLIFEQQAPGSEWLRLGADGGSGHCKDVGVHHLDARADAHCEADVYHRSARRRDRRSTVSSEPALRDDGPAYQALTFTITRSPGAGAISREVWTGISGNHVALIPVETMPPNTTDTLPSFEAPTNWADNYGTRLRGYITAPVTGSYTFWIASDNKSELWLSTDDNPLNKVKIASVPDWTNSRDWNKYPTQKSAGTPITLTAGQRYYGEALQKEGDGGDNLAVGWAKPGESTSAPSEVIPSSVSRPSVRPRDP